MLIQLCLLCQRLLRYTVPMIFMVILKASGRFITRFASDKDFMHDVVSVNIEFVRKHKHSKGKVKRLRHTTVL